MNQKNKISYPNGFVDYAKSEKAAKDLIKIYKQKRKLELLKLIEEQNELK